MKLEYCWYLCVFFIKLKLWRFLPDYLFFRLEHLKITHKKYFLKQKEWLWQCYNKAFSKAAYSPIGANWVVMPANELRNRATLYKYKIVHKSACSIIEDIALSKGLFFFFFTNYTYITSLHLISSKTIFLNKYYSKTKVERQII